MAVFFLKLFHLLSLFSQECYWLLKAVSMTGLIWIYRLYLEFFDDMEVINNRTHNWKVYKVYCILKGKLLNQIIQDIRSLLKQNTFKLNHILIQYNEGMYQTENLVKGILKNSVNENFLEKSSWTVPALMIFLYCSKLQTLCK